MICIDHHAKLELEEHLSFDYFRVLHAIRRAKTALKNNLLLVFNIIEAINFANSVFIKYTARLSCV